MDNNLLFPWVPLAFFVCLSFLMSGMEAGVFALSPLRIRQLRRQGDRRAELLHGYLARPENFFWTILVGNTFSNISIFVLLVLLLQRWVDGRFWLSVILYIATVFAFYCLCELLPKVLFRQFPNRICLALARPFQLVRAGFSPLVWLASWFAQLLLRLSGGKSFTAHLFGNREEVRYLMEESASVLSTEERALINRVLELQNVTVGSITVPWERVTSVEEGAPLSEVVKIFRETKLQRLPVWKAKERRIAGIINLKKLLFLEEIPLGSKAIAYVQPPVFLDERMRLDEAIRRMQRTGRRLAVVIGRDNKEIGIVSLHDMLKVIFGEVAF